MKGFIDLFIFFLFLAVVGLRCCTWAFSSCGEWGLLFIAVHGVLIAVASLVCGTRALGAWTSVVVAHTLSSCGLWALGLRLSSCGAWALLLRGMWDLSGPGLEPVSPALAGRFLTTAPPGKSWKDLNIYLFYAIWSLLLGSISPLFKEYLQSLKTEKKNWLKMSLLYMPGIFLT